jgi:tape measure domain-containing protein
MTDIELRLTADVAQATKGVSSFRKEYEETVRAIEKPLKQVGAFRDLESNLEGLERQSRTARERVRELGTELANTANPSKTLTATYKDAVAELQRLTRAESLAQTQLAARRRELQSARIDTTNLAAEQKRLTAELNAAALSGRRDAATQGIRAQSAALGQLAREQRLANLEQAKADFGISRARQYEGALTQLRRQYDLLRRSGNLTTRELAIAQQAYTRRVLETKTAMGQLQAQQRQLSADGSLIAGAVGGVGAAYATVNAVRGIANQADAYNLMNARLKLATASQAEFTTAQTELARIAEATQAPVASLATLYGRISRPLKEAGRSQGDILKVTEAVATSFRVSGATAEEAQNGVIQFAQALGAGALRGDEFNSVAEQAPRLMQALADSIGVPVGALREMAAQGLLTADVVTGALVDQLGTLRKEAETLPETVGGAMTVLADKWNQAIGGTDVQPLIDQINRLSDALSDPEFQQGLQLFSGLLIDIAANATGLLTDAGNLSGDYAAIFSALTGNITELDRLDAKIKMLRRSVESPGPTDRVFNFLSGYSEEDIKAEIAQLEAARIALVEQQTGMNAEMQRAAEDAKRAADELRQREIDAQTKYVGELKTLQDKQLADAEKQSKALVDAQKKANADLEGVKKARLEIEKRYSTALAGLGGTGDASYASAQALKVGARNALQAGDVEGAQAQAQAALKMLQDLASAGENTYGFGGFIKELEAIELAANDIEQTRAEDKITAIGVSMATLAADAEKLKNLPVSVKMDEASLEGVRTLIQQLAQQIGSTEIVLPVRAVVTGLPSSSMGAGLNPPGYATGGKIRGPGTGTSDSILMWGSNGEFMQPAASVNYYGEAFMEAIRQRRLPKYATGGLIGERSLPAIPTMNPALVNSGAPSRDFIGDMNIRLPSGESMTVAVPTDQGENLRLLRLKFGSTHN